MSKKILVLLLITSLLSVTMVPFESYAATNSWESFKDGLKGTIVGAADGYLQTESIGGALAGSIKGSFAASINAGFAGKNWQSINRSDVYLGDLHNEGLKYIYDRFQFNSSQLSQIAWSRIDRSILTFVWEERLYNEDVDLYLRNKDFSYEEIMKRIKASSNNGNFPISENFYSNLEKALLILDGDADNPEVLVDEFIAFLLDAAAKESGEPLVLDKANMDFEKIKITYTSQKSMSSNNDIIIANVIAHFTKKGYDYYKSRSDSSLNSMDIIIVVPKRAQIGVPVYVETDIQPTIRGLEIIIDKLEARVGIDKRILDVAPFVDNGRTMVPFRFIGESLGAEIQWNPEESSVNYVLGDKTVRLYIGKNLALLNGEQVKIDENSLIFPKIVNSRTMVPIRFISESLGFDVSWNPETRAVGIMSNPYFVSNELAGEMTVN